MDADEPLELTEEDFIEIDPTNEHFDVQELSNEELAQMQEQQRLEEAYILSSRFIVNPKYFNRIALARDDYREKVRDAMLRSVHPELPPEKRFVERVMLPEKRLKVLAMNMLLSDAPVTFEEFVNRVEKSRKFKEVSDENIRYAYCIAIKKFMSKNWITDADA